MIAQILNGVALGVGFALGSAAFGCAGRWLRAVYEYSVRPPPGGDTEFS